ncbi:hypothetical protein V6N13_041976 [Hibiscus sabdariffa]
MGLNALSGPIPKNLGSLQNIQILSFAVNFLENSNDFSFLISLTNCTNLSYLQLSQNNLTGVLPDSIGNFSANLIELKIDTNYISGTIPKEIGNLVGLEFLSLHKNMLTGKIVKKGRNFPRRVVIATGIVLFVVLFLMCLCAIKQVGLSRRNEDNASPLENKHLKLSYAELLHATNDFSSANIIDEGFKEASRSSRVWKCLGYNMEPVILDGHGKLQCGNRSGLPSDRPSYLLTSTDIVRE